MNPRLKKLLSYYKPYTRMFVINIASAILISMLSLALPLGARYITNDVLAANAPNARDQILVVGALMVLVVIVYGVANHIVDYRGHMMGAYMEADMRRELFAHYQTLSMGFYDEQKTGQLMSRLTNDLFWLSELFHHGPEDLSIALVRFLGTFVILMAINPMITLIVFAALPVVAVFALHFNRKVNHALAASKERVGDINAQVEDALAGIRVVKSFTNEAVEQEKFARENRRFVESRRDGYHAEAWFDSGMIAFTQMVTIVVMVIGGLSILSGTFGFADLLTYLLCVSILIDPVHHLVNIARLYHEGATGFSRFMDILDITPSIQDSATAVELTHVRGHIQFRNVSFQYKPDYPAVLNNLSLDINVGDYVALVGSSGVGKTTLCSLIPRFYDVTEGEIRLDGHDIRDITLQSLRAAIGIVQQDVYLFSGTVADNIRYGRLDASMDDIIDAAKQANAHEFIMALPHGYDTDIGQRGVKLSGGQKQRLSIARVFLKNPPILIFDEATSALDNESEKAVQASLERLTANRTTLVIAHRLSTVRNAQRIVVLTDTGIAEQGTHDDLIARDGAYASLYNIALEV